MGAPLPVHNGGAGLVVLGLADPLHTHTQQAPNVSSSGHTQQGPRRLKRAACVSSKPVRALQPTSVTRWLDKTQQLAGVSLSTKP